MTSRVDTFLRKVDTFLRSSSDFYDGVFSTTKKREKLGRVGQIVWMVTTEQKGHVIEDGLSSKIKELRSRSAAYAGRQAVVRGVDCLGFLSCRSRADPVQCFCSLHSRRFAAS